jgi:hypothetical protein
MELSNISDLITVELLLWFWNCIILSNCSCLYNRSIFYFTFFKKDEQDG